VGASKVLQAATKNLPPAKQADLMGQLQAKLQHPENVAKLPAPMKLVREQAQDRTAPETTRKDDKERDR